MKRETRAELKERADRKSSEAWLTAHALHYALHTRSEACAGWREANDVGRYMATLYGSTAPHGGIVLVTFRYPGQSPMTTPYYFDAWHRDVMANRVLPLDVKLAAEKLHKVRAARLAAESEVSPE